MFFRRPAEVLSLMKVIHTPDELPAGRRKACLAIGVFDGVHLGHQQIIRQTVADARQHDAHIHAACAKRAGLALPGQ